jgi:hypothetical protein
MVIGQEQSRALHKQRTLMLLRMMKEKNEKTKNFKGVAQIFNRIRQVRISL